jgi:hypothetical protein
MKANPVERAGIEHGDHERERGDGHRALHLRPHDAYSGDAEEDPSSRRSGRAATLINERFSRLPKPSPVDAGLNGPPRAE